MKRKSFLLVSLVAIPFLSGCGESVKAATFVDVTSESPYGKITDFSLNASETHNAGDVLTFKVNPNEDFNIASVTNNGQAATQVLGQENVYQTTLQEGQNKISATYTIDKNVNVLDEFKLNLSEEDFAKLMYREGTKYDSSAVTADSYGFDFRQDGIELVRTNYLVGNGDENIKVDEYFMNYVDGDTTHVETLKYGYTVKIRYLGIDTPESSSDLEEWGKTAALYNESKLKDATYIILQSQGRAKGDLENYASTVDGNGRNLAYVWYTDKENPVLEDFKCLNLEMVYQGLSQGIGDKNEMGEEYYYAFDKANLSAQVNARHEYSNQRDENYCYAKPQDLTIEEIYDSETGGPLSSPYADEQTLYRVSGWVTRKVENAFFFQNDYDYYDDVDTGAGITQEGQLPENAFGMYVFTYRSTPISVGDYVTVIGVLTSYGGNYQMSGISYSDFGAVPERDTIIDYDKSVSADKIKPVQLTAEQLVEKEYDHVLVEVTDDLYCYDKSNGNFGIWSDGGTTEINQYNSTYPFYNDNNKIICYADTTSKPDTSDRDGGYRLVLSQEVLLQYQGEKSTSYKFFSGGDNYYLNDTESVMVDGKELKGAAYIYTLYNWDTSGKAPELIVDPDQIDDRVIKTSYTKKKLHLTCISQDYISTSNVDYDHQMLIVSRADVKISTY